MTNGKATARFAEPATASGISATTGKLMKLTSDSVAEEVRVQIKNHWPKKRTAVRPIHQMPGDKPYVPQLNVTK